MPRIATLLLAAGGSSRMGRAQKLLERAGGEVLVTRAARAAVEAGLGPVLAVTGDRGADVRDALPDGVRAVRNPLWQQGLSTSLRVGLAALPADTEVLLIALGDMPLVTAAHHRAVAAAWQPGRIVVPTFDGQPGHPVAVAGDFLPDLAAVEGDRGFRSVILAHREAVIELALGDVAIVTDVDDPEALARVRTTLGDHDPPSPAPKT